VHPQIERLDWGMMDYAQALALMRARHAQRVNGEVPDGIICVQHPPVFTLGRQGRRENVLLSDEELEAKGFGLHWVERVGDVTYHGPGQAVVYLVIDLRERGLSALGLIKAVAGAICDVVASYGLEARWDNDNPGVWVNGRKIAAVGMAIPRKVTLHGLALNVQPKLEHFDFIRACGLTAPNTSLAVELGHEVEMGGVFDRLYEALCRHLNGAGGD